MKSLLQKLQQLEGLIDTSDVSEWEQKFLKSVVVVGVAKCKMGKTGFLTEKQLDVVERIYDKHFA